MKDGNGGFQPSCNMQVSTEAQARCIAAVGVTNDSNDLDQLIPALDRIEQNGLKTPQTIIAGNGYAARGNVEQSAQRNVELIAPWKDEASRQAGACATNGIAEESAAVNFQRQARGKELLCPAGRILARLSQLKGFSKDFGWLRSDRSIHGNSGFLKTAAVKTYPLSF